MRLICTIPTDHPKENPYAFSYFLTHEQIVHELEEVPATENAPSVCHIWIKEEDDVERAQELYKEYQLDPSSPRFKALDEEAIRIQENKLLEAEMTTWKKSRNPPLPAVLFHLHHMAN